MAPGYHFFHFYEPAYQVGGDYFDYVTLPSGSIAVVLGDVSGKGVSAALLMAKLSGEVRFSLASEPDPAAAVRHINETFCRDEWADRFITFVAMVANPKTHEVTIVNAGHMPPLLRKGPDQVVPVGEVESGVPLGVQAEYPYTASHLKLSRGQSLTVYTDGFSEAMNADKQLFGMENLRNVVGAKALDVDEVGQHVVDAVRHFAGGYPQSDDMCLVCFGRTGK